MSTQIRYVVCVAKERVGEKREVDEEGSRKTGTREDMGEGKEGRGRREIAPYMGEKCPGSFQKCTIQTITE